MGADSDLSEGTGSKDFSNLVVFTDIISIVFINKIAFADQQLSLIFSVIIYKNESNLES